MHGYHPTSFKRTLLLTSILGALLGLSGCGGSNSSSSTSANHSPIADAGPDLSATVNSPVTLDGSGSSDADGDTLSYAWTILLQPDGSNATLTNPRTVNPTLTPDTGGRYIISMTVDDGKSSTNDRVVIIVSSTNNPPAASAVTPQSLTLGETMTLDASGSSDPDGDTLSYQWSIVSKPSNSSAVISASTSAIAEFTPDIIGAYIFQIEVSDGSSITSARTSVQVNEVNTSNTAPVASVTSDIAALTGVAVTLDSSASSDADGDTLTHNWSIVTAPQGSTATLSNPETATPSLTPDIAGVYLVQVTVSDGTASASAQTRINAEIPNKIPVANAGADQTVNIAETVTLDGSSSSDEDGDSLSYVWSITTAPSDSTATIADTSVESTTFTPDVAGQYVINLTVSDGKDEASDSLALTVNRESVDITDMEFSSRSVDCNDYIGTYFSNVTDIKRDTQFSGSVNITSAGSGTDCTLYANMIPNHDFNDASANFATDATAQVASFNLPGDPQAAASNTTLALGQAQMVFLNGVVLETLAAACYGVGNEALGQEKIGCGQDQIDNPWRYDPMSPLNNFGTDTHNAHVQPGGKYHYHGNPNAMYLQDCSQATAASPVIGFAADGFPVYGTCVSDGNGGFRDVESSFALKSGTRVAVASYMTPTAGTGTVDSSSYDGQFRGDWTYQANSGDLDECNGMTVNGQYGYYITDSFPWGPNCFKGTTDSSFSGTAARFVPHSHRSIPGLR